MPTDPMESPPAQFPSLPQQARNASGAIFRAVRTLMSGQPVLSPEVLLLARLAICKGCTQSTPSTVEPEHRRCLDCGCYLYAKAKLISETCPLAKW